MGKKRKSDASRLDEVDRSMYSTFCSAASFLSQLYTQAMHQQRLSFQAGERHSLENLHNWISRQQESGVRVTTGDILAYIQNEFDSGSEDLPQQTLTPATINATHSGFPPSFGAATVVQRPGNSDQAKTNNVFSNALSSPVRRNLQHYQLTQGGYNGNNAIKNNEHSGNHPRDPYPPSSNDTPMDMHADSPGHNSPY